MFKPFAVGKRKRYSFSKIKEVLTMPNLIAIQKNSYDWFLKEGLGDCFRDLSPIQDFAGNLELTFGDFQIGEPKYDVEECKERDASYSAPINVNVRLLYKDTGEIKESRVFMGDLPLMTDTGTFIINGAERVIVSQLVRSPGVYYTETTDSTAGNKIYTVQMIPGRGVWIEFETDANGLIHARVDRTRKFPATLLLRALGLASNSQIQEYFNSNTNLEATLQRDNIETREAALVEIYKRVRPGEPATIENAQQMLEGAFFDPKKYDLSPVGRYKFTKKLGWRRRILGRVLDEPFVDSQTGEVIIEDGVKITKEMLAQLEGHEEFSRPGMKEFKVRVTSVDTEGNEFTQKVITTSCIPDMPLSQRVLIVEDILSAFNYLLNLMDGVGSPDDIDHLGNRRLRCVGELLHIQYRNGLVRMDRVIRERMAVQEIDQVSPNALINIRPVVAAVKEFFGSSQLSQFMDQTNPLAELTHKRRLSALGPGGLSRERAGYEVRDVHHSHYGRMCPIETPEGPNIGLIGSLSTFAIINEHGFMETPYRRVDKETNRVTEEIVYLAADEEDEFCCAQANEPLNEDGSFKSSKVTVRYRHEILSVDISQVDFMDVSPKQVVSIATALIPFLENDDANRALMGANMQRQAVPLLRAQAPLVGTGMEYKAAVDSGVCVLAKHEGVVERATSREIKVRTKDGALDSYKLLKFKRSNQGTCINQIPIVKKGDIVEKAQVLADGPSTDGGELALGYNVIVAFMPWEGYNYEDAILLNEDLVKEDVFTSIHIENYECEARDTKLGPEEITCDIPNISDNAIKDLDDRGIIRIGAEVRPGDILVGKVTPKGETELTAEEKLLRAIFGEKAREVRDTSLRVPHGEAGKIVDVKVFSRDNGDDLPPGVNIRVDVHIAQKRKISEGDKMAGRHGNKGVVSRVMAREDMPFLPDGRPVQIVLNPLGVPSRMNIGQILETHLGWVASNLGMQIKAGAGKELADKLEALGYDMQKYGMPIPDKAGVHMATSVFDGAHETDIFKGLELIGANPDGKTVLYDGRTGEPFDNKVTVGCVYMLKLHHLVDDKIHARSTGPYSLVTQQPLGGKAQFGGQRFGEMEVWALEAYGAAYTLQELLTVKSDDVLGRVKTYEAIVKGENVPEPGLPESFRVLVKELQSIGLDIKVLNEDEEEISISDTDDDVIDITQADFDMPQQYETRGGKRSKDIPEDEYDNESENDEDILEKFSEVDEKGEFVDTNDSEDDFK